MRMGVVPIDFRNSENGIVPVDGNLYTLVMDYCKNALAEQPKIEELAKTWAVVEYEDENIVSVTGLAAWGGDVPDHPLWRVTGPNAKRATKMLQERINGFHADRGARGRHVFIYISDSEHPEQRCPDFEQSLKDAG